MDIRIYGKEDKTLILANTVAFDFELTKEINKLPSIQFTVSKYDTAWELLETEGYISCSDGFYVIKDITVNPSDVDVFAVYDAEVFQYNHFPTVGQEMGGLGSYAADLVRLRALSGWTYEYYIASGVQPATVEINWEEYEDGLSVYDALQVIIDRFNAEFVIDNVSKTLFVYEAMHSGVDRGAYIIDGFNITDSSVSISSDDIITRLYPYGKDDLDISDVNPTGMEYIDNFSYTNKIIEGVWKDERYEIAQNLYNDAVALLASKSQPSVNFSLTLADMYAITGNINFKMDVGDTVRLSLDGNESIQVVVRMVFPEDDPESTQIELASVAGSLLDTIANLENRSVNSSGGGGGSTSWDAITGKPSTFPSTWDEVSGKPSTFPPSAHNHDDRYYTETEIDTKLNGKQNTLVSGTNIKTINGNSLLGSGNIVISGGGGSSSLAYCSCRGTGTMSSSTSPSKVTLTSAGLIARSSNADFLISDGGLKCVKSGVIMVSGSIYYSMTSARSVGVYIYKGTTEITSAYDYYNVSGAVSCSPIIIPVNAGDIIYLYERASTSTTLDKANSATHLDIVYLATA